MHESWFGRNSPDLSWYLQWTNSNKAALVISIDDFPQVYFKVSKRCAGYTTSIHCWRVADSWNRPRRKRGNLGCRMKESQFEQGNHTNKVSEHEELVQNAQCHPTTLLQESISRRSSRHIVGVAWHKADALRSISSLSRRKGSFQATCQRGKVMAHKFGSSSQKVDSLGPFLATRRCDQAR